MPQMTELVLNSELDKLTNDATGNNSTFIKENEELLDRYEGNPYGDEIPERSKVISNDVMDIVESDMPSLARIFLGAGDVFKFKPTTAKPEDIKEAEEKTKYINWIVRGQPDSFTTQHGFIKNALMQKISVVKYFMEESTEIEEHKKTGLSNDELALYQTSLEGEDVKSVKVIREEENDTEENTIVFKVERTVKSVKIENVKLENFRMTKNAQDKNKAGIIGDVALVTRGELLSQGFSKDKISSINLAGDINENSRLPDIRDNQEGGDDNKSSSINWASEEVEVEDLYPLIDFDGDGIAERRRIMRAGDVILINEVFNHAPYAINTSILMPHKTVGKCRAEITAPTARVKTSILRGVQDNIYAVNNPRIAANKNVNMDDLLVMRQNGVVRTKDESNPGQNMFAVEIPYIGDKSLQVLQYWDSARAQTTGSLMANQGLNADDLGKETATRFNGVQDASKGKVELVARVMAETGYRQLFEGIAWVVTNFQNASIEIEVLGKELTVDPRNWQFKHHVASKVGLGAGDDANELQTMTGLWTIHQQLQAANSPMTDEVKRYNILKNMINASGTEEDGEFINNPERPEQLVTAQNELLTRMVQQLQEQLQLMQNPLKEAEEIKAQATLIKAQGDAKVKVMDMQIKQDQFNKTMNANFEKMQNDTALKLTEMETKYNTELNKQYKDNEVLTSE